MRKGYGAGDYASYKTYSWDFEVRTTIALMLHNLVQSDSFNLYMCLGFWTNWQTIFESEKMSPFFAFLSLFPQSMVNGRHFSDTIAANLQLALCVRNNITKVDWRDFFWIGNYSCDMWCTFIDHKMCWYLYENCYHYGWIQLKFCSFWIDMRLHLFEISTSYTGVAICTIIHSYFSLPPTHANPYSTDTFNSEATPSAILDQLF